jgi:hypothetical protein
VLGAGALGTNTGAVPPPEELVPLTPRSEGSSTWGPFSQPGSTSEGGGGSGPAVTVRYTPYATAESTVTIRNVLIVCTIVLLDVACDLPLIYQEASSSPKSACPILTLDQHRMSYSDDDDREWEDYESYDEDRDDDSDFDQDDSDDIDTIICPECGAEVFDEAPLCPSCGLAFTEEMLASQGGRGHSAWYGRPWWWVALAVLGAGALCWGLLMVS